MKYIKHLTKIEIVGTDLIRGYYEDMMFEVHLNGPNFQTDVICGETTFIDEPSDLAKKVFKELEEYLKADYETRIEMLGAKNLVNAIDDILNEYIDVVLASNCPEVEELNEILEGFLGSLNDGQLTESIKEMEKVLQDFIFYANIEKERQKALEGYHELITEADKALRVLRDLEQTSEVVYYQNKMLDALDYAYNALIGVEDSDLLAIKLRLAKMVQESF